MACIALASDAVPAAPPAAARHAGDAAAGRAHHGMAIAFAGDADRDVAAGMIPRHRGAIGMAHTMPRPGGGLPARTALHSREAGAAPLRAVLAAPR